MKFAKNVLGTFSTKIGMIFLSMLSGAITARVLGPADRGVLTLVTSYAATIAIFCFFGINQANIYLINREKKSATDIGSNSLIYAVAIGSVASLLSYFFQDFILSTILKGVLPVYFMIIIVSFPFILAGSFMQSILRALGDFKTINMKIFYLKLVSIFGVVVLLLVFDFGLTAMIYHSAFIIVLSCLPFLFAVKKRVDIKFILKPEYLKSTFKYGLKAYSTGVLDYAHMKIDIYFLAYFLTTSQVAYYDISVLIGELLFFFPHSVGMVLFPKLAGLKEADMPVFTSQICRLTLFVSFWGAMFLLLCSHFLIKMMYGTAYLPAFWPMAILLPGICNFCIYDILSKYFASLNKQRILISSSAIALSINIIFNLLLIPVYGIKGAAMATSLSYSLAALMVLYNYCKITKEKIGDVLLIKKEDIVELLGTVRKLVYSISALSDLDMHTK